uniref:Uncharacterized protein n=1 Tax=Arundo donax TaxID=35708 RepID=A0A0A8Y4K5_ARUDO
MSTSSGATPVAAGGIAQSNRATRLASAMPTIADANLIPGTSSARRRTGRAGNAGSGSPPRSRRTAPAGTRRRGPTPPGPARPPTR